MKTAEKKPKKSEPQEAEEGEGVDKRNRKAITPKKKTEPIEDKKDNYEKKPSEKLKKKRSTSDGYMAR